MAIFLFLPGNRQMEQATTECHRFWYHQCFQEWARHAKEEEDGLLHGLAGPPGPPGPLASSAWKSLKSRCGRTWWVTWWV